MFSLPQSREVDTRLFANMLDYSTQSASYKPLWLGGILAEAIKGKREITFKEIACHMISKAWYPITHCKLSFGTQDSLPKIVSSIREKYDIKPDEKIDTIYKAIYNIQDKEIIKQINVLYNMVPYRLLSPFYKISSKENFNKRMKELTSEDGNAFYTFGEKQGEKSICLGEAWHRYLNDNQVIINAWIEYSLIYFLQKKNPNVPAIPLKITPPDKRDLGEATKLWKYFGAKRGLNDIYINRPFTEKNITAYGGLSIDHFIPWSFVLHDEIWNLAPSFKNINSSKSNALPNLDVYMKDFCNLQYQLFDFIRSEEHEGKQKNMMNKLLEDYVHIMPSNWDSTRAWYQVSPDKFMDCLSNTIMPLYQIAYNQGYDIWECKDRIVYDDIIHTQKTEGYVAEKVESIYMKGLKK